MIERGWSLTEAEHERAQDERRAYCERMEAFFDDVDLLLTPTLPVTAFPAGRDQPGEVAGRPTEYLSWTAFTYPFNVSGQPAASVPCGMLDGLPVGLQIVGRAWRRRPGAARRAGVRAASTVVVRRPRSGINRLHGVNHLMPNRFRDLAGPVGLLPTGPRNTITDVPGVLVGHSQAGSGEPTGVTVVAPPRLPVRAGVATTNGVGELTKKLEIDEWGIVQTAIYLCGTHALGIVYHGAILAEGGDPSNTLIPVVGECDDSDLADGRTVTVEDVDAARAALGVDVPEGSVGSGTGMTCFDFAGGIGTASRAIGEHALGVLLMCNFGERERLTAGGLRFDPAEGPPPPEGSCIAVCATDAPMTAQQLRRLALRPLLGLARAGSYAHDGSGEIGIAFTTAREQTLGNEQLNPFFAAAYEAAEEAVYNCLVAERPPMRKRDGREHPEFPRNLLARP